MEIYVQRFLNKLSFVSITVATFTLVILFFLGTPFRTTCNRSDFRFPESTCDVSHRTYLSLEKKNRRLWNTRSFQNKVSSFSRFFQSLQTLGFLHNHSSVLCVSAGAGHQVMALTHMGVDDATGVELIDSPPLVQRADPHNLPFFDGVFDLAFSAHLDEALFPDRFVAEMERTVRKGGAIVVVLEQCGDDDQVREVVSLFRKSRFLGAENVALFGSEMTRIIMTVQAAAIRT